jgi:outer membrane protein OmpA-like peptidoglycan-associated protein
MRQSSPLRLGRSIAPMRFMPVSAGYLLPKRCACGGEAGSGGECAASQAKLTINEPGDQYEQEADRVAEQVMHMPDPGMTDRVAVGGRTPGVHIQWMCPECKDEEKNLHTKEVPSQTPAITPAVQAQVNALRGGGQPLPSSVRTFFEPRFGQDFSQVRIHTDSHAAESARAVNALAYTIGQNVVFGPGQYAPGTTAGRRLLAHELTHTIHQGSARGNGAGLKLQRQADGQNRTPSGPLNGVTIDLLDPLNSSVRIGGRSLPSPRDIMSGMETIHGLGRPRLTPFEPLWPTTELDKDQLRESACRALPGLCLPPLPGLGSTLSPTLPSLRLELPEFRMPKLTFVESHTIDHFTFDSEQVPDRHRLLLDQAATALVDSPNHMTDLIGHADTQGDPHHNLALSEKRAKTVHDYLTGRRVPEIQFLGVAGVGETQPLQTDDQTNSLSAARNRRVNMTIRQLIWESTFPSNLVVSPGPTPLGVVDARDRVLEVDRPAINDLRDFLRNTTARINTFVASLPVGTGLFTRDNENIRALLSLLDQLVGDLKAERLLIRFNSELPPRTLAAYIESVDMILLRPFNGDEQRNRCAINLVHEYAHVLQDRTLENLLRTSEGPIDRLGEDEIRTETEASRHELYFQALLRELKIPVAETKTVDFDLDHIRGQELLLSEFERERTGSPNEQAAARKEIRRIMGLTKADQIKTNTPMRVFLIRIDTGNTARLHTGKGAPVNLGVVPTAVTNLFEMNRHLRAALDNSGILPSLFVSPTNTPITVLRFIAFRGNFKVAEFERP